MKEISRAKKLEVAQYYILGLKDSILFTITHFVQF